MSAVDPDVMSGSRWRVKAIDRPSGDQSKPPTMNEVPSVKRRGFGRSAHLGVVAVSAFDVVVSLPLDLGHGASAGDGQRSGTTSTTHRCVSRYSASSTAYSPKRSTRSFRSFSSGSTAVNAIRLPSGAQRKLEMPSL
jgi:hypothetical protein